MAQGDVTLRLGTEAALTVSPASLASSTTRVAGRESTAIACASVTPANPVDFIVAGKITLGTSPTAGKVVQVWVYASYNDTPTYPDSFTGSDSARSATSENVRDAALKLGAVGVSDATTGRVLWLAPFSVAALFGGNLPQAWGIWIVHDTGVALDATAGNHAFWYTPVYANVAP